MCGIVCPIQDITSSFYDINPPCLCHHTHYIWHGVHCVWMCHHIHCIDDITPTVFLRSHPLKFTKSYPVYMTWQQLDLCHNTHSFDITRYLCMTSHPLYVQHHIPHMKHHTPSFWDHTTLCMTSHALYSWHHSLYIWQYIHSICAIKTSGSIITCQLSVWHYSQYAWHHMSTLWLTPVQVWHQKEYIYDIITMYMLSMLLLSWKHNYTWHLTHYIWHHSHCICAATPTVLLPSQQLWKVSLLEHIWYHTHTWLH